MTTEGQPPEVNQLPKMPASARWFPLAVAAVGMALGGVNAILDWWGCLHFPLFIAIAPGALLIGLAGVIEPRVFWSVRPGFTHLPWPLWAKVVGYSCWVVGIAVGCFLYFWYLRAP